METVNYGCNKFYYTDPWGQCYKTIAVIFHGKLPQKENPIISRV